MGYQFNISMCCHNKFSASATATPGWNFQHKLFPTFYLPSGRVLSILSHTPWLKALCFLKYMCFDIGNSIFPNRDPDILASVVSWMVTPQKICTHPNPRDLGKLPKMAKGVMKWRILRRGAYPGWGGWAPNPITDIPESVRQRGLGHTGRRRPRDPAPHPQPTNTWRHQELERQGTDSPLKPLEGVRPFLTPGSLTSGVQNGERICYCLLFWTTQFVVICYDGPRKLTAVS